jgi:two-component system cell cycle response regulator
MDVLIAHGSAAARQGLGAMLGEREVTTVEAGDGTRALEILLRSEPPRLALVDWDLPGLEGPELCRIMRDFHLGHPPYIILVTPAGAERDVTAGLLAGANDFVFMPADPADLLTRVDYGLRLVELPWGDATIDGGRDGACGAVDAITGVDDCETVMQRLAAEVCRAQREKTPVSVGLLHLAQVREAKELAGASGGDAVLREVARRLRSALRPYDVVGRCSEDEFLVVMPNTREPDLSEALARLRLALAVEPVVLGRRRLDIVPACGGATGQEESPVELLAKARAALGEARSGERDGVVAGPRVELRAVLSHELQPII